MTSGDTTAPTEGASATPALDKLLAGELFSVAITPGRPGWMAVTSRYSACDGELHPELTLVLKGRVSGDLLDRSRIDGWPAWVRIRAVDTVPAGEDGQHSAVGKLMFQPKEGFVSIRAVMLREDVLALIDTLKAVPPEGIVWAQGETHGPEEKWETDRAATVLGEVSVSVHMSSPDRTEESKPDHEPASAEAQRREMLESLGSLNADIVAQLKVATWVLGGIGLAILAVLL